MVVGGRALEEEEEGARDPAPHLGNFAFYYAKTSESSPGIGIEGGSGNCKAFGEPWQLHLPATAPF